MTQIPWRSGKLLVWDVTVVSTTARGGNGCHQERSEVLSAIHGIPVPSNRRADSGPNE